MRKIIYNIIAITLLTTFMTSGAEAQESENAQINIEAVKVNENEEISVYSGNLGGYDSGSWNFLDFSDYQGAVIFDWSGNDTIYIYPKENQISPNSISMQNITNEIAGAVAGVENNVSLLYNGEYYESELKALQNLKVETIVKNMDSADKNVCIYLALYNGNTLKGVSSQQADIVSSGNYQTLSAELSIPSEGVTHAKIFVWNADDSSPYMTSKTISLQQADYYSDTFEDAVLMSWNRTIHGALNSADDADIIKIKPEISTGYNINAVVSNDTVVEIYNSSKTKIQEKAVTADLANILCVFEANNEYYIKISGNNSNSYQIDISESDEFYDITESKKQQVQLTSESYRQIFKIVPESTSSYIITAVGNTGLNAELYDAQFNKISESEPGDGYAKFRITHEFSENQVYYIMVSPVNRNGEYTLYAEQPFELISIN